MRALPATGLRGRRAAQGRAGRDSGRARLGSAAGRSGNSPRLTSNVARLRLAPVRNPQVRVGGTSRFPPTPPPGPLRGRDAARLPSRAPFFRDRLSPRAAEIAAWAEEKERGNLPVSPYAPSPAHRPESR